jgi:hypothetical protein
VFKQPAPVCKYLIASIYLGPIDNCSAQHSQQNFAEIKEVVDADDDSCSEDENGCPASDSVKGILVWKKQCVWI